MDTVARKYIPRITSGYISFNLDNATNTLTMSNPGDTNTITFNLNTLEIIARDIKVFDTLIIHNTNISTFIDWFGEYDLETGTVEERFDTLDSWLGTYEIEEGTVEERFNTLDSWLGEYVLESGTVEERLAGLTGTSGEYDTWFGEYQIDKGTVEERLSGLSTTTDKYDSWFGTYILDNGTVEDRLYSNKWSIEDNDHEITLVKNRVSANEAAITATADALGFTLVGGAFGEFLEAGLIYNINETANQNETDIGTIRGRIANINTDGNTTHFTHGVYDHSGYVENALTYTSIVASYDDDNEIIMKGNDNPHLKFVYDGDDVSINYDWVVGVNNMDISGISTNTSDIEALQAKTATMSTTTNSTKFQYSTNVPYVNLISSSTFAKCSAYNSPGNSIDLYGDTNPRLIINKGGVNQVIDYDWITNISGLETSISNLEDLTQNISYATPGLTKFGDTRTVQMIHYSSYSQAKCQYDINNYIILEASTSPKILLKKAGSEKTLDYDWFDAVDNLDIPDVSTLTSDVSDLQDLTQLIDSCSTTTMILGTTRTIQMLSLTASSIIRGVYDVDNYIGLHATDDPYLSINKGGLNKTIDYDWILDVDNLGSRVSATETAITSLNTTVGTLDTRVGQNETDITTQTGRVNTAFGAISMNTSNIGTVSGRVSTVETSVSNNDAAINTNEGDITILNSAVGTLDSRVSTVETSVSNNDAAINTNEGDITILNSAVGTLDSRVTQNETDISNIVIPDVTSLTSAVEALDTRVTTVETSVSNNDAAINTNEGDITILNSAVGTLDSRVSTVETSVSNNDAAINTNEGDITILNSAVGTLDSRVTAAETTLSTNDAAINTNEGDITILNSAVGTLDTRVTTAETTLSTNNTSILANESDIVALYTATDDNADNIVILFSAAGTTDSRLDAIELVTPNIATNTTNITTNANDIDTNTTAITTNTGNISTNSGVLTTYGSRITQNEDDIEDLQDIMSSENIFLVNSSDSNEKISLITLGSYPNLELQNSTHKLGLAVTDTPEDYMYYDNGTYQQRILFSGDDLFFQVKTSSDMSYDPTMKIDGSGTTYVYDVDGTSYIKLTPGAIPRIDLFNNDDDNSNSPFHHTILSGGSKDMGFYLDDKMLLLLENNGNHEFKDPDSTAYIRIAPGNDDGEQPMIRLQNFNDDKWEMYMNTYEVLQFAYNGALKGYLNDTGSQTQLNFTGAHTCEVNTLPDPGRPVYLTGDISRELDTVWESLPILSTTGTEKKFYGIFLEHATRDSETPDKYTVDFKQGIFTTTQDYSNEKEWIGAHGNMKAYVHGAVEAGDFLVPVGDHLEVSATMGRKYCIALEDCSLTTERLIAIEL